VFGICLLNDWSARDIQGWEYQPLGPFLSKNFATTVSPWVVTLEALAPYRLPFTRPADDPQPLPYLDSPELRAAGAIDIRLAVQLQTPRMREAGQGGATVCQTSYRHAYWTVAQMVAHHTVNGCNLMPGDLLGSGTLSGPTLDQAGALIELTQGGKHPWLAQWRNPHFPGRRRLRCAAGLVRTAGRGAHRVWRMPGHLAASHCLIHIHRVAIAKRYSS
jgi:fumarylacetoacetase